MRDSPEDIDIEENAFDFDISEDIFNLSEDDFSEFARFENDTLGIDPNVVPHHNQRKTVRYIRKDIIVSISNTNIFGVHGKQMDVKLLDISSKGALIASSKNMRINSKVRLFLVFGGGHKFEVNTKIHRKSVGEQKLYGIKFEKVNDELAEHLLESQTELIFK